MDDPCPNCGAELPAAVAADPGLACAFGLHFGSAEEEDDERPEFSDARYGDAGSGAE